MSQGRHRTVVPAKHGWNSGYEPADPPAMYMDRSLALLSDAARKRAQNIKDADVVSDELAGGQHAISCRTRVR